MWAADSETTRPCSATAKPSSTRSRVVSLKRARTAGSDSVNEARGQSRSLQRHRRLCQISRNTLVPYGMSRGRVQTRPLRQTESTPQLGHAAAVSSALTTCTTRAPKASTRPGRRRGRPGRADARAPIPGRFGHGDFAYVQTGPWPHLDQRLSLSTAMITRSRASRVSALDPSCPVKSKEPF
jgi:hypothetical protein